MSIPLFFPPVTYVRALELGSPMTLRELCKAAGTSCRASGAWTERQVEVVRGKTETITAEPGMGGRVRIVVGEKRQKERARFGLAAMAYALHDLVAKASISKAPWARIPEPRGRPKSGLALTSRERQRRFRAKSTFILAATKKKKRKNSSESV